MTRSLTIAAALAALAAPAYSDGDAAAGENEFRKCKSCHEIATADETLVRGGKTGPNLYGVVGRTAGTVEGFNYGDDLVRAGEAGLVWDEAQLAAYMEDPRAFLRDYLGDNSARSRMTFRLRKGSEDVAAYLATVGDE
ncbi:cytochrome c family protein [Pseudooceanicola batsensis HTCC2597]|uniref:Cytochrome c family protein n=1 Tax=Pseudooceanicola batsensis (strain ATCC BAA-863 / DSM 15984 / KCTC 12145 / HTCC2597) TaxID=252305 RepID=A3TTF5_PSEBH|nr:cytochrome c550 [Pseudooceanicola batsensis]EAQ04932.1 cytochrome c family protein [Pseudooceanicola batsensis HTCC2597]